MWSVAVLRTLLTTCAIIQLMEILLPQPDAGMTGVHCHVHYEKEVLKRCGSANLALSCLGKSGSCSLLVAQCQLDFAHQHMLAKGALWNVVTIQF